VTQPISTLLLRLWKHISTHRRRQLGGLLLLMIFTSIAEVFSISSVLPFLAVLTAPEKIFFYPSAQHVLRFFDITHSSQLILPITVLFGLAAILAGFMRLALLWAQTRLSFAIGADLGISIYRRTLYQPYEIHVTRNSSVVIGTISTKINLIIFQIVLPILTLLGATFILMGMLGIIFVIDPLIAVSTISGFGLIYVGIIKLTKNKLLLNGQRIAEVSTQVIKTLQEGLGGIRDVLIDGSQETYCKLYRDADVVLRRADGNNVFLAQSPRYAVETLGMLVIAGVTYLLSRRVGGLSAALPALGALALAAQRMLPILQQCYGAWSNIRGGQPSLEDALILLDQPLPDYAGRPSPCPLPYADRISLNGLSFRYSPTTPWILKDVCLTISKGARLGVIGTTGSGKSTLLDIVMGLLHPSIGSLEVDGVAITADNRRHWQAHIAHVPQAIFLTDATLEENIALGVLKDEINFQRVVKAAEQAQLSQYINSLPEGLNTLVGERGVQISGGQRQRIGIARALYKQADVIIFDEATSALDNETEQAVMSAIENLNKDLTILIIAHRLTTLHNCTDIIEVMNGHVQRVESPD
jgi:ABC-type multidrug transport system fused ATPase/permease subunit